MLDWYHHLNPALQDGMNALGRVLLFVLPVLILVPGCIWWERRFLSWMQDRIGPNRVGTLPKNAKWLPGFLRGRSFWGLLQPIADGVKLFFKEDITPSSIDRVIYFIAPAVALFPAFTLGGVLPWGPNPNLTPIADVNIGVLYILAISSLGVYGVVLAGYASNNKYSLMGGLRASAQLISYELGMGVSLAAMVLATGSLRLTDMVHAQSEPLWGVVPALSNWFIFTPFGFVSAVIFLICMVAETNRAPFDLPEAENELIAGYHTEYSSMKFAVFFMGEYAAMLVFSGVFATVFLGGWNIAPIRWAAVGLPQVQAFNDFGLVAAGAFVFKCFVGLSVYIWMRATLPRLRYDQLMSLGWKSLLPLATGNFIVVALWILLTRVYGPGAGWISSLAALLIVIGLYMSILRYGRAEKKEIAPREVRLVDPAEVAS